MLIGFGCILKMAYNVPRLCGGWVLEALSFKLAQSLIEFQMLNVALQPSLRKTAVSCCFYFRFQLLSRNVQLSETGRNNGAKSFSIPNILLIV